MSTFISVIVPVYNTELYLRKCIDSILNQSYSNYELIAVDDGSTDGSGDIIDEYANKNERVVAIHKVNGGSSSARNLAIEKARGDYLAFVDSDDYVEPDFLQSLVAPVNEAEEKHANKPLIVQVGRDEISEDGSRRPDICTPPEEPAFYGNKDFFKELIMHRGDCSFCTKLVAKELFAGREFPVGKLNEDFRLLIDMLLECDGVLSLPGYKYHVFYRLGSNSRRREKDDFSRVYADCIENADIVERIAKEKYQDLQLMATRFGLFQRLEYMLHIPISKMNKSYPGYRECVHYIRIHWPKLLWNQYLTKKNRIYLTIFAACPRFSRKVHAKIKGL